MTAARRSRSRQRAEALAKAIERYWGQRGYEVRAWVEAPVVLGHAGACVYEIRSDMQNGWPLEKAVDVARRALDRDRIIFL